MDVTGPLDEADALAEWLKLTKNGTVKTSYDDIDYYRVFQANTRMLFSNGFGASDR